MDSIKRAELIEWVKVLGLPSSDCRLALATIEEFFLGNEYELKRRPLENHTPAEMLEFMMEQHNKKSVDLPIPHTRVSEILSGKRSISRAQAIALGEFFHVSPVLFLGL